MILDKNIGQILFIIIIALVLVIVYYVIIMIYNDEIKLSENMINVTPIKNPNYSRTQCNYLMGDTLKKVLEENKIENVSDNGNIVIPCTYDEIDEEIKKLNLQKDQSVHIIHNADHVSAKDYLWNRLVISAGIDRSKTMMANTYILNNPQDKERLKHDFKKGGLYIMKKNIQRQEGLKITDSLDEILNAPSSYVIAQELLQDPYTINVTKGGIKQGERKTNMRFYILVVCKEYNMDVYVFNNGFMYYTKEIWVKGSKDDGPNITTGYIDRWIYEENPLTHEDFKNYLDRKDRILSMAEKNISEQGLRISDVVFNRIYNLLREVFVCIIGKACDGTKLRNNVSFQLFGADIAVNDQLWPMCVEINKGPDLGSKDERDGSIKTKCTKDMLKIIGAVRDNEPNGFIQIINKNNDRLDKVCI
jgi:hypothetical protein